MTAKPRAVVILAALSLFAAWAGNAHAQLPSISIDDAELPEGSAYTKAVTYDVTPFPFTVTLSAPSTQTVTVQYKTTPGTTMPYQYDTDYNGVAGVLTFAPGETEKTITVSVFADFWDEPTEAFNVELSNASNATIARDIGIGTILNDDPPPTSSDLVMTMISPKATIHIGEDATLTFQITNNSPDDVNGIYFEIQDEAVTAEASQGPGCLRSTGGEGSGGSVCALNTIASGATATVTVTVHSLGLYCPELQFVYQWPRAAAFSRVNNDPNRTNDTFSEIHYSDWVDVQPIVMPATLDLAVGSAKEFSVQVRTSSGETLDVSADDDCISVPPAVTTSSTSPFTATIPVTAISGPCAAHVVFNRHSCSTTYRVPVTTHALSGPVAFTFDPSSPSVTAGQTIHVHVNASPLSQPVTFSTLALTRTIEVPSSVVIDPVTGGDIAITGLSGGAFSVMVSAPPALGSTTSTLSGQVLDVSPSSGLSAVAPNSGSTNGGTLVRLTGSGFAPDCWSFFDNLAAHNVVIEGTTSLVAATPRHGAGTAGIALRCSGAADSLLNNAFTFIAAMIRRRSSPQSIHSLPRRDSRWRSTACTSGPMTRSPSAPPPGLWSVPRPMRTCRSFRPCRRAASASTSPTSSAGCRRPVRFSRFSTTRRRSRTSRRRHCPPERS